MRSSNQWKALPLLFAAGLGLSACSSGTTQPAEEAEAESTQAADSSTSTTPSETKGATEVEQVAATYSSLAPKDLFEKFDSCTPNGLEGSHECSGSEVGQFQFYDSSAKATSSTQQLTQLRSSHVMRDTGDMVVGWSTLGTSAVITVVDNKKGLVMQQLVSSDKVDPEKRIVELGLADAEESPTSATPSTSTAAGTTSAAAEGASESPEKD
ncbi:hypothetical protein [Corynebacterium lowii]|uniref:Beta-N-acetylhexosaminidase n=1 Tax=Corynebacterium lowii TaxID=1544413 RepID=A0A0Q0YYX8_9CORY|nr:hypothetical protein [Corynebacterium lowii]KQB87579.1 hypothetical protein Clow_00638 [Corynebacterium lowii]MDP9851826.1 hypothetical protein [Corynebacterium lowii]